MQILILLFLLLLLLFQIESIKDRWRNNNYVIADGILPYQRCNSSDFYPGAVPIISTFKINNIIHDLFISAVSTWGISKSNGEPEKITSIDILTFYNPQNTPCILSSGEHCAVNAINVNKIEDLPLIECIANNNKVNGVWNFSKLYDSNENIHTIPKSMSGDIYNFQWFREKQNIMRPTVVTITCPFNDINLLSNDKFDIKLNLKDNYINSNHDISTTIIDVCYEHVEKLHDMVVCTEPLYGFTEFGSNNYWHGVPPFYHNLLDAFLLYHFDIHKASIMLYQLNNNENDHELYDYLKAHNYDKKYDLKFRNGWNYVNLHHYTNRKNNYLFECIAETTCMWENRFRSKYFIILHAMDNFILPVKYNNTFTDIVKTIETDFKNVSGFLVPIINAYSSDEIDAGSKKYKNKNVLLRYNRLSDDFIYLDNRHTPMGNPRHITSSFVHWLPFINPVCTTIFNFYDTFQKLKLHTVHIMGLTRKAYNVVGSGTEDLWYSELANRLQKLLFEHTHIAQLRFNNKLLQVHSQAEIFYIINGTRHSVPDFDTFNAMKFDLSNIIHVSLEYMESLPLGMKLLLLLFHLFIMVIIR